MSAKRWRPGRAQLLFPLAVSLAPWISTVAFLRVHDSGVEGAMFVTASIGVVSFLLTGPLAGIVLAKATRESPIVLWNFARLFFLVSAPALGFQIFGFGMSVLPAVTGGSSFFAAVVGVAWYSVFLAIFYRFSIRKMAVVSSLLVLVSFVFLATRLFR